MVQLLHRAANNPIITAADLPYPANAVFNPGAARRGWERRRSSCCEWRDLRGISDGLGGAGQATTRESRPARRPGRDDQDEADAPDPRTRRPDRASLVGARGDFEAGVASELARTGVY